jgi:hypothetical protein
MEDFMKFNAKDPQTWISRDLFESYCGSGSEKLLYYYDKAVQKRNVMAWSMNWFAFLLLPAWFGYRKQWHALATLAALLAVLPFVEGVFDFGFPNSGLAGGLLALAFMANGLLLMSANSIFTKLKKSGMDMAQIRNALENKASSSVASAIVGTISFLILQFAATIIADMMFGLPA